MIKQNAPIIEASMVSKRFAISRREISLRQEGATQIKHLLRRKQRLINEDFYALKDVSFTIDKGESVGIVGRNGAGKTTLLRILSRIVRPSDGRVTVRGSYASLIGIGAGFVDSMTGRKNIYLMAAIYGLNPSDIEDRVDDIISFADVSKHIDMPIKDYSSGMRARLGFSIAVHTLPDIVFLDEVLSVGDVSFQKKSKLRLLEFLSQNKTVIFVSHSSSAVVEVCQRAIWLHDGRIRADGDSKVVVSEYLDFMKSENT